MWFSSGVTIIAVKKLDSVSTFYEFNAPSFGPDTRSFYLPDKNKKYLVNGIILSYPSKYVVETTASQISVII